MLYIILYSVSHIEPKKANFYKLYAGFLSMNYFLLKRCIKVFIENFCRKYILIKPSGVQYITNMNLKVIHKLNFTIRLCVWNVFHISKRSFMYFYNCEVFAIYKNHQLENKRKIILDLRIFQRWFIAIIDARFRPYKKIKAKK